MNYLIAKIEAPKGACRLGSLKNVPKSFQLQVGRSRAVGFPTNASFTMNEDFPKDITLTDALHNQSVLLVASVRLKEFLESIPGALYQNELLPVKIINHKGREEKAPYFIINQLDRPVCIDEKASVGTKSPIAPEFYQFMSKMVLDESRIDPKSMLFRTAQYRVFPLVRRDLAEKLEAEKFTGISFHEIDGYKF